MTIRFYYVQLVDILNHARIKNIKSIATHRNGVRMAVYSNRQELEKAMMKDLTNVLFDVATLSKEIVIDNVQSEVYDVGSPQVYERQAKNRGFLGSWDIRPQQDLFEAGNFIMSYQIFSNPDLMDYIPEQSKHGHRDGDLDRRSIMDVAIAEGTHWDFTSGVADAFYEAYGEELDWWKLPRDYFTPSIETISDEMDLMVQNMYKKRNIDALPSILYD